MVIPQFIVVHQRHLPYDGPPGFIAFNYNPNARPGQLTLIQSASTNFVTGQTVFISYTTI
jgi:hypothetical protein